MTDNDVIKALEDWLKSFNGKLVDFELLASALNIIKCQKTVIERCLHSITFSEEEVVEAKANAVKDFSHFLIGKAEGGVGYEIDTGKFDKVIFRGDTLVKKGSTSRL